MKMQAIAFGLVLAILAACDRPAPEERLESAGKALESTKDSIASLGQRIEEHEQALAKLKRERRRAEERVLTLEERVAARATDVALFRSVQSALLDDEALQQSAIAVDARQGAVTLSGTVSSEDQRARAIELAENMAGVERVVSRIDVEPPSGPGETR